MTAANGHDADPSGLDKVQLFMRGVEAEKQFRLDDARIWYERARDHGHILAEKKLAALDERSDEGAAIAEKNAELLERATSGDPQAQLGWRTALWCQNRAEEALQWIERAASSGHRPAVRALAWQRHKRGDLAESERLYRLDAEHGDLEGLRPLADHLRDRQRVDEAIALYERMAYLGDDWARIHVADLHLAAGRFPLAEQWYASLAFSTSDLAAHAAGLLGAMLVDIGRGHEAEGLLRTGAERGTGEFHLAWVLESRGQYAEAEEIYRDLAESDWKNYDAMAGLARMLERRGRAEQAKGWREGSSAPDGTVPPGPFD